MSVAQTNAARRRLRNDGRYKPKKGNRGLARRLADNRKKRNAGKTEATIGYKKKGQG